MQMTWSTMMTPPFDEIWWKKSQKQEKEEHKNSVVCLDKDLEYRKEIEILHTQQIAKKEKRPIWSKKKVGNKMEKDEESKKKF